jgi:hypothetical protein
MLRSQFLSKIVTLQQNGLFTNQRPFGLARPPIVYRNRNQYYGYAVSSEWLMQFTEQHYPGELLNRSHVNYEEITTTWAHKLLASQLGIYYLDYRKCLNPPPGGIISQEWIALVDREYDEVVDTIQVFFVCSDRADFELHPMKQQLHSLTKLIRHPPQWWTAYGFGPWAGVGVFGMKFVSFIVWSAMYIMYMCLMISFSS